MGTSHDRDVMRRLGESDADIEATFRRRKAEEERRLMRTMIRDAVREELWRFAVALAVLGATWLLLRRLFS